MQLFDYQSTLSQAGMRDTNSSIEYFIYCECINEPWNLEIGGMLEI